MTAPSFRSSMYMRTQPCGFPRGSLHENAHVEPQISTSLRTGCGQDNSKEASTPGLALHHNPPAVRLNSPPRDRPPSQASPAIDGAALAKIIGTPGEQTGPVYKITIGRPDINLREYGAAINARMGLNTWAAFAATDADAMVAGDVAMLEQEVTPVLKALRANGINVVAIHNHMTGVTPDVIFLHYYGTEPAPKLAQGVRAVVDLLGKTSANRH